MPPRASRPGMNKPRADMFECFPHRCVSFRFLNVNPVKVRKNIFKHEPPGPPLAQRAGRWHLSVDSFTVGSDAAASAPASALPSSFAAPSGAGVIASGRLRSVQPVSAGLVTGSKEGYRLLRFALCSTPCLSHPSCAARFPAGPISFGSPGIESRSRIASRRTNDQTLPIRDSLRPNVWPSTRSNRSPSKYNPVHRVKNHTG